MDAIARTTELEAINEMLNAIGEGAVSSIDTGNADVATAVELLRRHSRRVQAMGWWFNTDTEYTLTPDSNGYLTVPSNCLRVDPSAADRQLKLVMRGSKLYDTQNQTTVFTQSVTADLVVGLDWSDLPQSARDYITACAGLEFVDTDVGSETRHAFTEKRKGEAWLNLFREESDAGDFNMLADSDTGRELSNRRI